MEFIDTAIAAAQSASEIHRKYFQTDLTVRVKTANFNRVTVADTESEKVIVKLIKSRYRQHNIIAEENKYEREDSDYTWIIDPLDGTNNYSCGIPIFCVSIALAYKNEIIAAVIYDSSRNELFSAQKGKGAFLNGVPIAVNNVNTLEEALLITGFYYDRGPDMVECLDKIKMFFFKKILGLRRLGAAALDLCYVACGRAAGYWEFRLNPWDFAAGKLIVEEAGGRISDKRGNNVDIFNPAYVVASNGKLHAEMLTVLN
jgi:myo-inositol-1(or 4)-monophosphatase